MMIHSDTFTVEQREVIKKYLGRYVEEFSEYSANKITDSEIVELYCKIPQRVILDTKSFLQDIYIKGVTDGEMWLAKILRKNQDTDFGKKY